MPKVLISRSPRYQGKQTPVLHSAKRSRHKARHRRLCRDGPRAVSAQPEPPFFPTGSNSSRTPFDAIEHVGCGMDDLIGETGLAH